MECGMKVCSVDPALFYFPTTNGLAGIICVHVDDLLWAGTDEFQINVIKRIHQHFIVGSSDCGTFQYVGIMIKQNEMGIQLNQNGYVLSIEDISLSKQRASRRSDNLSVSEASGLKALIGQLVWLSSQSRPDISFDVCQLSGRCRDAKVEDLLSTNKVVRSVRDLQYSLFYPQLSNIQELSIECYCDASFANLDGGGSQGGYVLFLADQQGKRSLISWKSRRVRRVVKSTIAAETLALLDGAESAVLLSHIVAELLGLEENRPTVKCFVDNRSLVEALYSTKLVEDKLMRINMAVLRDMIQRGDLLRVSWVQSASQLADALTKRGANVGPLVAAISQ